MPVVESPASFVEAATLPAMSVEEADPMVATVDAETAADYSKKHPKMTLVLILLQHETALQLIRLLCSLGSVGYPCT